MHLSTPQFETWSLGSTKPTSSMVEGGVLVRDAEQDYVGDGDVLWDMLCGDVRRDVWDGDGLIDGDADWVVKKVWDGVCNEERCDV